MVEEKTAEFYPRAVAIPRRRLLSTLILTQLKKGTVPQLKNRCNRNFPLVKPFALRSLLAFLVTLLFFATPTRADRLQEINARGELIWGGDQEGGGPYVYPDPNHPERVIGFEVDLAELIAGELGVRARFHQADWNTLPEFLQRGSIDIILNGYEWTPQRSAYMRATNPYYIYELQLLAREGDARFQSWKDVKPDAAGRRPQIGVLRGSAAEAYLRTRLGDGIEIVGYDGNTDAMTQVRAGIQDATFEDLPIALFYRTLPQGQGLRFVGEPVGRGYYVMFVGQAETALADAINAALDKAYHDGRLRNIYERYGIWNATQAGLPAAAAELLVPQSGPAATDASAPHGLAVVHRYAPILLRSAWMTIKLSVLSMPLAVIVGLFVALGRLYGPVFLRPVLAIYVELLRGTPVMLQLYVIYFLLPSLLPVEMRASFSPVVAAVLGLAINYSAYEAEIYRAGLQAIPKGQMEAALALGMTRAGALRRVIVPQAVRLVVPPVTNDFIALFKDTSICSVIAVTELSKQYNVLANSTGAILELAIMTAVLYLAMSYPLSLVARYLEKRLAGAGANVLH